MAMKRIGTIIIVLIFCLTLFSFPLSSLAVDKIPAGTIPDSVSDITPPAQDISSNPDFASGTSNNTFFYNRVLLASNGEITGGCSIRKNSSTSVTIAGHSEYTVSDPAVRITLYLQAYYDGAWHTLATTTKSVSGRSVSLSQGYTVTSGYYYRTYAYHSTADGASKTSHTSSIYVG
jgi:hypothetical protein